MLTHAEFIHALKGPLQALPFVCAAWLEGADAAGRADDWSDIDLWLDVAPADVAKTFEMLRQILWQFGPLNVDQSVAHADPQLHQHFFRSQALAEFWFLDVVVQEHGRSVFFGPHDPFQILFDRCGVLPPVVQGGPLQTPEAVQALVARHWRWLLVEKEVRRGHTLEAHAYYRGTVLADLVTLLRLRDCPGKADYVLKHIQADLPRSTVQRLEKLYACTGLEVLTDGVRQAEVWFSEVLADLGWPERCG